MKIVYYLGFTRPLLSGGMVNVMLSVEALRSLGHDARVVAPDPAPRWAPVSVPWELAPPEVPDPLRDADAVITGWSGVATAFEAGVPIVAHLCAGPEQRLWPQFEAEIREAYTRPTVKLVVAPHLVTVLREELGVASTFVGTPIELSWFRDRPRRSRRGPLRILSVGSESRGLYSSIPFKGIATVLEIVRGLREAGHRFEFVRLAPRPDPLMDSELVDERRIGVPPLRTAEVYGSCDLFLSASTAEEGLGRPAVEAAVSGLASVLPEVPSFTDIPGLGEAALFYRPGDVEEAVRQAERLFVDEALRRRLQGAGPRLELEDRFSPLSVARRVEAALKAARKSASGEH